MGALTRRRFISCIPAAATIPGLLGADIAGKGRNFPAAVTRYADPSTEFAVARLTDPAHTSILPAAYQHPVSKRNFMLIASDMTGRFEAFRLDLKNGQARQLTDAENLNPNSLALLADDRGFCYADGDRIL